VVGRLVSLAVLVGLVVAAPASAVGSAPSQVDGPGSVSWSVTPATVAGTPDRPNFVLEAAQGEVLRDALVVENLGSVNLVLGVYASDAFNTPNGGIDLLAADEEPVDLGSWIRPESSSITVPAQASVEVPFTIEVPEDAAPGDHAGGIVTSLRVTEDGPAGNRVQVERRLGTRIYVRVDGELRPELTFTELSATYDGTANPFAPGAMELTYRVENTGNVRLRATRGATVSPSWGPSASVEAGDMAELLPGNSIELTQTVPGVWPGWSTRSQVELVPYEPSGETTTTVRTAIARTSSSLVPWPQVVAAVLLLLAAAAWFVARRRSRRRLRSTVDEAVEAALAERTPPPLSGSLAEVVKSS
jgi:hypothetical protein